ncbi:hypothetical protein [Tsuneonella sp. HG222]
MTRKTSIRIMAAAALLGATALGTAAIAQQTAIADPTKLQPVPDDFTPKKTAWGDPDISGTWPIDNIASIPMARNDRYGNRFYLTAEELAERAKQAEGSRERYEEEDRQGKIGMGHWVESDVSGSQTAFLVDPPDGKLPALTPAAEARYKTGRSSWTPETNYDWVADFDTWDRCVTRGFPASMFPFRYNNGIRVHQSPGFVVLDLEMIHDSRIIPVVANKAAFAELQKTRWPANVRSWMGQSLGYWEDKNTLVVETTNIIAGDSVAGDGYSRGPSPLNMATLGVPPWNTIPTSDKAKVTERITMIGPDSIVYEVTYNDPEVFTKPWTARLPWSRDEEYGFFEYACHEGNVQVRNYINSSRSQRGLTTSLIGAHDPTERGGEGAGETAAEDGAGG